MVGISCNEAQTGLLPVDKEMFHGASASQFEWTVVMVNHHYQWCSTIIIITIGDSD